MGMKLWLAPHLEHKGGSRASEYIGAEMKKGAEILKYQAHSSRYKGKWFKITYTIKHTPHLDGLGAEVMCKEETLLLTRHTTPDTQKRSTLEAVGADQDTSQSMENLIPGRSRDSVSATHSNDLAGTLCPLTSQVWGIHFPNFVRCPYSYEVLRLLFSVKYPFFNISLFISRISKCVRSCTSGSSRVFPLHITQAPSQVDLGAMYIWLCMWWLGAIILAQNSSSEIGFEEHVNW